MTDLYLMKQASLEGFTEAEKAAVRKFLFQAVDGHGEKGKKGWRLFWKRIMAAEVGEMWRIISRQPRSGPYHRRHMLIENAVFDAQERFEHFEMFRDWLKIGSGFVIWVAGPRGGVVPLPKSISYDKADQDEFAAFHSQVISFLRSKHAAHYLWPHLNPEQADQMMDTILRSFEE